MARPAQNHDQDDDARAVLYATCAAALILLQQVGSKAARDALFLTSFAARELPKIMAGSALVSLVVVLLSARAVARLGPARFLPIALLTNAALFAGEAVLSRTAPAPTSLLLYVHVAALGSVLVSGFWSLVTERFDPHRARRYMGRIGIGATLGGACGGLAADGAMRLFSAQGLLAWLGISSAVAAMVVRRIGRSRRAPPSTRLQSPESPLTILRTTPYLRLLGALAALGALWAAMLDYSFKAEVSFAVRDPEDLMRFFGWFYTATGVLTFLVQAALGEHMLRRHGIGVTVGFLPTFVAAFALLAGLVDVFAVLVLLRTVESVLSNSIHRASYELFFTPLPQATKRPTKTIVDVAATRIGDAIGSALILVGLALIPTLPVRVPILVASGAAFAAFALVPRLHKGYVDALTKALKTGTIRLDDHDTSLDALTHRTLAESTHLVDREKLLEEIEAFRRDQVAVEPAPKSRSLRITGGPGSATPASLEARFAATLDPVVSAALILVSRDTERIRRVLERPVDPQLTSFLLPLLVDKKLAADAERALAAVGPRIAGQLTDALHDDRLSRTARARVARVLGGFDSVRAREGLFEGLSIESTPVRLACARAIADQKISPEVAEAERPRIFREVAAALDRGVGALDGHASMPPPSDDSGDNDELGTRLEPRIRVALALLSAALDREAVLLATRALAVGDPALRGTALEYLENVLEEPAKTALLKTLAGTPRASKRRTQRELLDELHRTKR
ncbi:MAG: hypothetical protein HOW73_06635 [Polyangiaceae bacterium]|nr:hypothetical protein [Polyangiaceae bacterium]